MSTAQLILEYIKALAWPVVVFLLILQFRKVIHEVLSQLVERLRSAESVKFGVMGQEIELSGTARMLLAQRPNVQDPAIERLNNPLADMVGVALLEAPSHALPQDELLPAIAHAMGLKIQKPQQAFIASALMKQLEPIVDELSSQGLISLTDGVSALTADGVDFFTRVRKHQQHALAMLTRQKAK